MAEILPLSHTLAVVPVSDFDTARRWYEQLFGVAPSNVPMPGILAEWRVTDTGWLQVTVDAERAGRGLANFASDDLDELRAALQNRGLSPEEVVEANNNVRLSTVVDPDGNRITFIGGFRVVY